MLVNDIFESFIHWMKTDSSSDSDHQDIPRKRRASTRLNEFQLSELRKRYKMDSYIQGVEKERMARSLGISPSKIASWFSKQRKLERKESRQH